MLEGGRISNRQFTLLITITVLATAILFLPAITTVEAKQDAWASVVLATTNGVFITALVLKLSMIFPDKTLMEYLPIIIGKVMGKAIGLGYIFYFIHTNAIIVREFGEFLVSVFLPNTPIEIFNVIIVFLAALSVISGIEVIGRMNEWIFSLYLLILSLIIFAAIQEMDLGYLKPHFEEGFIRIIKGSMAPTAWFGEIVIFTMIFPFIRNPKNGMKHAILGQVITGLLIFVGAVQTIAIFGANTISIFKFPIIYIVRLINIADFIERIEPLIMVVWVAGVFIKVSVFYYVASLATAQLFNLKTYRPCVFPIGIILISLSMLLFGNVSELVHFLSAIWPVYSLSTFEVGIPITLLIIALIRGFGRKKNHEAK